MLIPIGHDQSIRRWPHVTIAIIVVCTLMQAYSSFGAPSDEEMSRKLFELQMEMPAPDAAPEAIEAWKRRAEDVVFADPMYRFAYVTGTGFSLRLLSSAFVHGGWLHLIGNMLFLWLAGSALEDRYGRLKFALFYALGAIAATYAFQIMAKEDGVLLVGASGAVSACMGAFLLHFHRAQIRFWYFLMYRSGTFHWPAWFALPLWLAEQLLWGSIDGGTGSATGIAYAAHIGGFAFGLVVGFVMSKLFPDDAADDDVEYDEPAARPSGRIGKADPAADERVDKLLAAVAKRDVAGVRTLSSRVIIDLARRNNDARIVEVYQAIAQGMSKVPLTVGAFAAAATAADRQRNPRLFVVIADAMIAEHPMGIGTPQVMWRLSQIHGDSGSHELEKETLRTLAKRFPRDEYGQRAARSLDD